MSTLRLIAYPARALRYTTVHGQPPSLTRGGHGGTHPINTILPFAYANKRTLALKLVAFFGGAFGIPFAAVWWQWNKPGGLHNP